MIPLVIAGIAGLALIGNPPRRKLRRRNPEMFKWKISAAILDELYYYEVENFESAAEAMHPQVYTALEAVGRKGPKTITLDRAGSQQLHDALDDMADIKIGGGDSSEAALGRATAKFRDKIAAELNASGKEARVIPSHKEEGKFYVRIEGKVLKTAAGKTRYFDSEAEASTHLPKTNPHLGNKGDEFKKHASLRLVQDAIEKEYGKRISLDQVQAFLDDTKRFLIREKVRRSLRVLQRANPVSVDTLALPVASMFWRKHGYQSPGHAEDLAMMARRGSTAQKLWGRVAQILKHWLYNGKKRSNPTAAPRYTFIPYRAAHRWETEAERRGVSEVARSGRGFMRAYEKAGDWRGLDPWWVRRRDNFIKRHLAQARARGEKLWVVGVPSRRALAMLMWAYQP